MTMILLDIDDTLIDHTKAEKIASFLFGKQYSNEIPDYDADGFSERWHKEAEILFQDFLSGKVSFQEHRRKRIRGLFGDYSINDNQADTIFEDYLEHYENSWELFPDVIPFLDRNIGGEFAVVSDGAQNQQELKLKKTGILPLFRFVITTESTGMSKPNPAFFIKACELAASDPAETFYIGNNIKKDAIGAFNAGLNGVWLNRDRAQTVFSIYTIENLTDFAPNNALHWTRTSRATEL